MNVQSFDLVTRTYAFGTPLDAEKITFDIYNIIYKYKINIYVSLSFLKVS